MKISENGLAVIQLFEGLRLSAYLDTAKIPTIGYGTIRYPDGRKVQMGDVCTKEQALEWLLFEVERFEASVNALVKSKLRQGQFDALVSFTYNLGSTALANSTLLKLVNANPNDPEIGEQFLKWNKSGGKVTAGLSKRRRIEYSLYAS